MRKLILTIVPEPELTWGYVIKSVFIGGLFLMFLLILLFAVAHSEWEDRDEAVIEETVYDTTFHVDYDRWLDQVDRDSVQVIFKEEHYTRYEEYSPTSITDQSPQLDSVFYDTVRYYRRLSPKDQQRILNIK